MGEHVGAESGDPIVGQLEVGNGAPLLKRPGVSALTWFFSKPTLIVLGIKGWAFLASRSSSYASNAEVLH